MEQSGADRRSLLKLGATALTGAAVPPRSGAAQNAPATMQRLRSLPRVDIAADRITRRITGLRPFRPSGFVVRAERLGEKTVIHNYGHGGCGVTCRGAPPTWRRGWHWRRPIGRPR
jgi:D-amino-acid oxidase